MPTTRGWGLPAPSYSVVTPAWLSDTQIGLPGPTDVPQGFFRFGSVCAASPGISETRFVWAYDRVAIALRPAEAGVTIPEGTIAADTAAKAASVTTKLRTLMVLPFFCGNESADRSRGHPAGAAQRDRRAFGRRLSLSSRASLLARRGKRRPWPQRHRRERRAFTLAAATDPTPAPPYARACEAEPSAGRCGRRYLADEVAPELVDQLPQRWVLVGVPAVEQVSETVPSRGHEPLVVLSARGRQLDRAAVSPLDERPPLQLLQRRGDLHRIDRELLAQLGFGQRSAPAQAGEQPQLRRSEVEAGPGRKPLVQLPALLPAREPREGTLDLAQGVVVARGVETVARVGCPGRCLQRHPGQEPRQKKSEHRNPRGDQKHGRQRIVVADAERI